MSSLDGGDELIWRLTDQVEVPNETPLMKGRVAPWMVEGDLVIFLLRNPSGLPDQGLGMQRVPAVPDWQGESAL